MAKSYKIRWTKEERIKFWNDRHQQKIIEQHQKIILEQQKQEKQRIIDYDNRYIILEQQKQEKQQKQEQIAMMRCPLNYPYYYNMYGMGGLSYSN